MSLAAVVHKAEGHFALGPGHRLASKKGGKIVYLDLNDSVRFAGLADRAKVTLCPPSAPSAVPAPATEAAPAPMDDATSSGQAQEAASSGGAAATSSGTSDDTPASVSPNVTLFAPSTGRFPLAVPDVPDDFYEHSQEDVTRLAQEAQRRAKTAREGGALQTRAMREAAADTAAQARKGLTRLRFRLPDRYEIEATFKETQTIGQVVDYLTQLGYFANADTAGIELFVTPPKRVLSKRSETLRKAGLYPAAMVFVSSKEQLVLTPEAQAAAVHRDGSPAGPPAKSAKPAESKNKRGLPKWLRL